MKALVTGGSGFVGAAIVRRLLAEGHAVKVLARVESPGHHLADPRVEVVRGDLLRPETLHPALAGCDALFHCAADYRLWVPDPERMERVNVAGTRALMIAALRAGVTRIVHTSSVATLATAASDRPGDETRPAVEADAVGPYKRSKLKAEIEVLRLVAEEGLPAVVVNPSTPMGPGDVKPTPTGRLVVEAARGRIPAFVDTGLNVVHVDDAAAGHLLAHAYGRIGERYILGGENLWLAQILAEIAALAGRRPPRLRLPHGAVLPLAHLAEAWARLRGGEPFVTVDGVRMARKLMFFTSAKAERELGYRPRPAREAIRDAVTDFRRRGLLP
jgi:dihydroflavonol-4-reductase